MYVRSVRARDYEYCYTSLSAQGTLMKLSLYFVGTEPHAKPGRGLEAA